MHVPGTVTTMEHGNHGARYHADVILIDSDRFKAWTMFSLAALLGRTRAQAYAMMLAGARRALRAYGRDRLSRLVVSCHIWHALALL